MGAVIPPPALCRSLIAHPSNRQRDAPILTVTDALLWTVRDKNVTI